MVTSQTKGKPRIPDVDETKIPMRILQAKDKPRIPEAEAQ